MMPIRLVMEVNAFHPSNQEAEADGSLEFEANLIYIAPGWLGLHRKTLRQTSKQKDVIREYFAVSIRAEYFMSELKILVD